MMRKYVALQPILHNGRVHNPGDTVNCTDPEMVAKLLRNKAVKCVGAEPVVEPAGTQTVVIEQPLTMDELPKDEAPKDEPPAPDGDPPQEGASAPPLQPESKPAKLGRSGPKQ